MILKCIIFNKNSNKIKIYLKMFKYLNPIYKTHRRTTINSNAKMTFFSNLNNNALRVAVNTDLKNNNLSKIPSKNFFSKLFNKEKTQEGEKSKSEVNLKDFKYQDKDGKLNSNNNEANEGEYNFSYNTETDRNSNYGENEIDEVSKNPEESLNATFSKEFLKIDNTSNKKAKQTKIFDADRNFSKLAKLIEFNLIRSTPSIVNQYDNLNFEADLAIFVKEMKSLGFDNQLLRSIFRKK
jgi:ubiquitin